MCRTPHTSQWFEGDATPPQDRGWWPSRKTCPWERLKTSWCSRSVRKAARNESKRFLRDTVVKTFGRLYNEFLPTKRSIVQENVVRRAHEVPTRQGAPRGVGCALHPRGHLVSFPDCYLIFYFSKNSKMEKYCLKNCFGVGLLTVPHTYSFLESETFWTTSLMYSSRSWFQ